jgi:outer membrane protein
MSKKAIIITFLMGFCHFAFGQENSWSLQKCMDQALENHIEIKIRQLEVKRVEQLHNSLLNQLLPSVNLIGDHSYNFGSTIDPSTNGRVSSNIQYDNFYINTKMNWIDLGAFFTVQKEKIDIEKAKVEKEIIENEYKLQLLESYFQALFTQELLKIQKAQLQNAQFNLERIQKEVALGSKPKSDLYDMQLSFSQEEKRIVETKQLYAIQKMQLFQLMNVENETIASVVLEPYLPKNETVPNSTEGNNPRIKLAELNYKSNLKWTAVQRANSLPTLSAYYTLSTFFYKPIGGSNNNLISFRLQLENHKNQQFGIQLAVPVFNGFRTHKKIAASKIETAKSQLVKEQEQQKLNRQLALEVQNQENYLQIQQRLRETLTNAQASFTTTQAKFSTGKIDALTFALIKNVVISSEYDLLKNSLQLQYISLKINLIKNNQF